MKYNITYTKPINNNEINGGAFNILSILPPNIPINTRPPPSRNKKSSNTGNFLGLPSNISINTSPPPSRNKMHIKDHHTSPIQTQSPTPAQSPIQTKLPTPAQSPIQTQLPTLAQSPTLVPTVTPAPDATEVIVAIPIEP